MDAICQVSAQGLNNDQLAIANKIDEGIALKMYKLIAIETWL